MKDIVLFSKSYHRDVRLAKRLAKCDIPVDREIGILAPRNLRKLSLP